MKLAKFSGQYGLVRLKQLAVLAAAVMFTAVGGAMADIGTVTKVQQTSKAYVNGEIDTVSFEVTVTNTGRDTIQNFEFTPLFTGSGEWSLITDKVKFTSGTTKTATIKVKVESTAKTSATSIPLGALSFTRVTPATDQVIGASAPVPLVVSNKNNITGRLIINSKEVTYNPAATGFQGIDKPTLVGTTSVGYKFKYEYKPIPGKVSAGALAKGDTTLGAIDVETNPKGGILPTVDPKAVQEAGTYKVIVSLIAKADTACDSTTLTIKQLDLADSKVTLTDEKGFVYNGEAKVAKVWVKEGATFIAAWGEGDNTDLNPDYTATVGGLKVATTENVAAGTAKVTVTGVNIGDPAAGNYRGSVTKTFTILQKELKIDTDGSNVVSREYDGTAVLEPDSVTVEFLGLENGDQIDAAGYTLTNTSLSSANVDVAGKMVAKGTVALVSTHTTAKNYKFATNTVAFSKTGSFILPRDLDTSDIVIDTSTFEYYYTGTARAIKAPTWNTTKLKAAQPKDAKLTVLYDDVATVPKGDVEGGKFELKVKVTGDNSNFSTNDEVVIGTYRIKAPEKPVIDSVNTVSQVRLGKAFTLRVWARSPNGAASALKYQWYKDTSKISGATNATYTYTTVAKDSNSTFNYKVRVTNAPGATVQVADSLDSDQWTISVLPKTTSLSGAKVTVDTTEKYIYTGDSIIPSGITVTLKGEDLSYGTDFDYVISNNVKVGTGTIRVTGTDAYEGSASGTFKIVKRPFNKDELVYDEVVEYTGAALPVNVWAVNSDNSITMTGLGDATLTYRVKPEEGDTTGGPRYTSTVPTDAGLYQVQAKFAEGANILGSDTVVVSLGDYKIAKRVPTIADLNYTTWDKEILVANAPAAGIGPVTVKAGAKYGKLTVLYNGEETVPTTEGEYYVWVEIEGGDNFEANVIELGLYKLVTKIAVAEVAREIPTTVVVEEAAVAPIKAVVSTFTVGPNVVSKSAGKVSFFSGKSVKSGSLYIFDANGNAVTKVSVKQSGRELGSWNLKNKGAVVAEGTYVVKGVLTGKDGTKEKVSSLFTVVR